MAGWLVYKSSQEEGPAWGASTCRAVGMGRGGPAQNLSPLSYFLKAEVLASHKVQPLGGPAFPTAIQNTDFLRPIDEFVNT